MIKGVFSGYPFTFYAQHLCRFSHAPYIKTMIFAISQPLSYLTTQFFWSIFPVLVRLLMFFNVKREQIKSFYERWYKILKINIFFITPMRMFSENKKKTRICVYIFLSNDKKENIYENIINRVSYTICWSVFPTTVVRPN